MPLFLFLGLYIYLLEHILQVLPDKKGVWGLKLRPCVSKNAFMPPSPSTDNLSSRLEITSPRNFESLAPSPVLPETRLNVVTPRSPWRVNRLFSLEAVF